MAMEQKHFQGCISNWKWSCHCHLVLSDCILQKAEKVGPTTLSTLDSFFFFVTPFFPKTNSDSTNSLWTFESRNANCTPCCVTMSKSLWIVPLVPLAAEGVARTGVGTVGFTVPEDVSLDWRRTGVRGRGAKAMGGRGQTSHQSWMAEDLSIQKSSCCRFVVFFKHMQEILSS